MGKHVFFEGDASIIDEPTGVLLQPGVVEVQDDVDAEELIERKVCREADDAEIEAAATAREEAARALEAGPEIDGDAGDDADDAEDAADDAATDAATKKRAAKKRRG